MPTYEAERTMVPAWRKARRCAAGECIEVAQQDGVIILRDSTQPRGTVLQCAAEEWRLLVTNIKAGSFGDRRP